MTGVSVAEGCFKGGLPRGDATEAPVGKGARCWGPAGAPEKDRFREGLTRGDSTEALVAGVAVAEDRYKSVLPRDHGAGHV